MNHFTSIKDVPDPQKLVEQVLDIKKRSLHSSAGRNKCLGLLFFNPSLRTRLSTQKAAARLGMDVMVMNISEDGWNIEFEDGAIMDGASQEHIRDAVQVISGYCDVIGVRSFARLKNREEDYAERILQNFMAFSSVPVISLESATLHPLQSLTDMATIAECGLKRPKVVLTWAPHPKKLPQAVANSFLQWAIRTDAEITLAHPEDYGLSSAFTEGVTITNDQQEAFDGADIIYAKNWSSFTHYGQTPPVSKDWMITAEKMSQSRQARFMHCLPIRRNVVATDEVINSSLVYKQAKNREFAAQAVLQNILEAL